MKRAALAAVAALALALAGPASAVEYRPLDGVGAHPTNPAWGAVGDTFARVVPAAYDDGVSEPAGNTTRPPARNISNEVFGRGPMGYNTFEFSSIHPAWGQLVAHDMGLTGPSDVPEPFDIVAPCCDERFDEDCLCTGRQSFSRTSYDPATGTGPFAPRLQINGQTGYLDASAVYGATDDRMMLLRTFRGGQMLSDPDSGVPENPDGHAQAGPIPATRQRLTGDIRGNVNPGLLALHGLLVLEHNRWCELLEEANPSWTDERLFQEARRRVVAIVQRVTYAEYLPAILGASGMEALAPYRGAFDGAVNPQADAFFMACAYRYGHSGVNSVYMRLEPGTGCNLPEGHLLLRDSYFQPEYLAAGGIAPILAGLVSQAEQAIDTQMVDDLRNFVEGLRHDLAAMDIQRGRDHGLPTYNQARVQFGLPRVETFDDLTSDRQAAAALESAYGGDIDAVDAWVGGLAEDAHPAGGTPLGELFVASIAEQFQRTRAGDPFWYQLDLADEPEVLAEIERTTLADVIARNTELSAERLPASVFRVSRGGCNDVLPPEAPEDTDGAGGSGDDCVPEQGLVSLGDSFQVGWCFSADASEVTLAVRARTRGWFAFGVGEGMAAADVVVAVVDDGGDAATVTDSFTTGYAAPTPDASGGGGNNAVLLRSAVVDDPNGGAQWSQVVYTRPTAASDSRDMPMAPGDVRVLAAWGSSPSLGYHGASQRLAGALSMTGGASGGGAGGGAGGGSDGAGGGAAGGGGVGFSTSGGGSSARDSFLAMHGTIMAIMWCLVAPGSVAVVRYYKHHGFWSDFHKAGMVMVTSVTVPLATASMTQASGAGRRHGLIGVSLSLSAVFLFFLGQMTRYTLSNSGTSGASGVVRQLHRWGGRLAALLGVSNCLYGAHVHKSSLAFPILLGWVVLFAVFVVLLELRLREVVDVFSLCCGRGRDGRRGSQVYAVSGEKGAGEVEEGPDGALPLVSWDSVRSQTAVGAKLVVAHGRVYEISEMMHRHPGGQRILVEHLGRDVSAYFTKPLEDESESTRDMMGGADMRKRRKHRRSHSRKSAGGGGAGAAHVHSMMAQQAMAGFQVARLAGPRKQNAQGIVREVNHLRQSISQLSAMQAATAAAAAGGGKHGLPPTKSPVGLGRRLGNGTHGAAAGLPGDAHPSPASRGRLSRLQVRQIRGAASPMSSPAASPLSASSRVPLAGLGTPVTSSAPASPAPAPFGAGDGDGDQDNALEVIETRRVAGTDAAPIMLLRCRILPPPAPGSMRNDEYMSCKVAVEREAGGTYRWYTLLRGLGRGLPDTEHEVLVKQYQGGAVSPFVCASRAGTRLPVTEDGVVHHLSASSVLPFAGVLYVCAGTGLVPFFSLLERVASRDRSARGIQRVTVFWSVRHEEDIFFRPDIELLFERCGARAQLIIHVQRPGPSWRGATGYFGRELLRDASGDLPAPVTRLVCGRPSFVDSVVDELEEISDDPVVVV